MCSKCGKGFAFRSMLTTHTAFVHSSARPHYCTECDKRYKVRGQCAVGLLLGVFLCVVVALGRERFCMCVCVCVCERERERERERMCVCVRARALVFMYACVCVCMGV